MDRVLRNVAAAARVMKRLRTFRCFESATRSAFSLIVVSSDTGLAGAFNANLFRMAQRFVDEHRDADCASKP